MSVSVDPQEFVRNEFSVSDGRTMWKYAALRWAIICDVIFCTVCGIALMLFSQDIAVAIGFDYPGLLVLFGGGLLPWAVFLMLLVRQDIPHRPKLFFVVTMNVCWVIGSVIFVSLANDVINDLGEQGVLIVAFEVLAFAIWQGAGVRRLPRRLPD